MTFRLPVILLGTSLMAAGMLLSSKSMAQDVLPSVEDVAGLVSRPETREETLFRLAALANFLSRTEKAEAPPEAGLIAEDLDWIRRLSTRHGKMTPRSSVLDPAAWLVLLELEQRELPFSKLISPLGAELGVYLAQVFDRSSERLASVILPELLWQTEPAAGTIWSRFTDLLAADEELKTSVLASHGQWLDEWSGSAPDIAPIPLSNLFSVVAESLDVMVLMAITTGVPDAMRLERVRYHLLLALPAMDSAQLQEATAFLRLAGLVDGLHKGNYFFFAEGLLALTGSLLNQAWSEPEKEPLVVAWLSANLPLISNRYARNFSTIDPRINSALAAAFDVVKGISRSNRSGQAEFALRSELADAAAQLTLLIPDLAYYFDLPVRDSIAGGMDACIGIMAMREEDGSPAMTRDLFDDCQQSLVDLADREARAAALSGDPDGPFGENELQRELSVTSVQKINYGIGYLHDRYSTGCQAPLRPLPNPLEWSALATLLAWFAEQSPVYFQTPENGARLERMREIGREMLRVISEQIDCFAGAGAVVSDPITRSLVDYRESLVALSSGINAAVFNFRREVLANGADVALQRDSSQPTAYRPADLMIGPCDAAKVCEMSGSLTSTRALWGLFPNQYLIADQTGLGNVEICYEEMAWVRRRSEQVRADDTNVANYFGHLEFKLMGRYRSGDNTHDVFGFRFTSPNEHHYLFAAATPEVLQDSCAANWVGQRIVTSLRNDRGIVPNRLTYLAALRMLPSRLLSNNWDRGAEWRDWFMTGIGVESLQQASHADISSAVNQQLQTLHLAEQAAIFQSVLRPDSRVESMGIESLFEETVRVTTAKSLLRQQFLLFYPQLLNESDELRSAVAGQGGLLDSAMLARFRTNNVPVILLNGIAFERLDRIQQEWQNQPESIRRTGSITSSLAHAMMRLNAVYLEFFAEPSRPLIPVPVEPDD